VQVKAGDYRIGGEGGLANQIVKTGQLWIRTWPITVAEYQVFVAAGGEEPGDWLAQQHWPNRPVVEVSWFQARAFCAWAQTAWVLPEAGVVDLPTSMEWEIAMRRGTGRAYPWGKDDPAQGNQSQVAYDWGGDPFVKRRGAPVGAFPLGHTPERGLEGPIWDAAGNVWEWCASVYGEEEVNDKIRHQADDNYRVLRGGSWNLDHRFLRAAYRDRDRPKVQSDDFGFRVLLRVLNL
jgi:formylglycine-generating enzyme required for sulfatase activity